MVKALQRKKSGFGLLYCFWLVVLLVFLVASCAEIQPSVYFTTDGEGISVFSLETNQIKKILNSSEALVGITHDSINDKPPPIIRFINQIWTELGWRPF